MTLATVLISRSSQRWSWYERLSSAVLVAVFFADGVDHKPAAGAEVGKRGDDGLPGGRRVDDGVKKLRSAVRGTAGPGCTEMEGKLLLRRVTSKDEYG